MKKQVVKTYINEIKKKIGKLSLLKRVFLYEIAQDAYEYTAFHNGAALQDLYDNIGTPDEIAEQFFSESDYDRLSKKAKKYKRLFIISLAAVIVLIFLVIVLAKAVNDLGGHVEISDVGVIDISDYNT